MTDAPTAVLVLVATVVSAQGAGFGVDAGLIEGLRVGDRGQVYYELKVAGESKRLDVGSAEVIRVDELGAELEPDSAADVRAGYRVEFELPASRVAPSEVLRIARLRLEQGRFEEIAQAVLEDLIPADPEIEEALAAWLAERQNARAQATDEAASPTPPPAAPPEPAPQASPLVVPPAASVTPDPGSTDEAVASLSAPEAVPAADSLPPPVEPTLRRGVAVESGFHLIGLPATRAEYFNQQPQFQVELAAFEIDPEPVSVDELLRTQNDFVIPESANGTWATGVSYLLAAKHCRSVGARLPTEYEWQVAVEQGAFTPDPKLLEWTSTWYEPYPGNARSESAYGRKNKVLRKAAGPDDPERHRRRYLDPARAHPSVGFRCAQSTGS